MKKRVRKLILMSGMVCAMSISVCGYGYAKEMPANVSVAAPVDQTAAVNTAGEWADSIPNLEGSTKDVQDGSFTVVEAVKQKSDNGGDIYVSAGSGDDSAYNKISVTYDENTLFTVKTIYDGGARSELSAATSVTLDSGQTVAVWGTPSDNGLKATHICIIKVE